MVTIDQGGARAHVPRLVDRRYRTSSSCGSTTQFRARALGDVLPRALRPLARRIQDDDPREAVGHLTALLRSASLLTPPADERSRWIARERHGPSIRVDHLARAFGISHRALRDWAHHALGMSVKRFLRIQRLHRAIAIARDNATVSWSEVAARSGFADQSHCIRDFRNLLGETPAAFLARGETR